MEQWSNCYQKLAEISPEEDLIAFEKIVSPQRLMTSLGFANQQPQRSQREQGLVAQLQNTSLSQVIFQILRTSDNVVISSQNRYKIQQISLLPPLLQT